MKSLAEIMADVAEQRDVLEEIHAIRQEVRGYSTESVEARGLSAEPLRLMLAASPARKTFALLAQGDSWFDYAPGTDLVDCLSNLGHRITNLAVAGSTLNDEAYGPVPKGLFGIPQSKDPDRIAELVNRIVLDKPQGLLLSAGGNDIAGDEFFSFINNARSGLQPINQGVLDGVVNDTFKTAYRYLIDIALGAARHVNIAMPIFVHGYDYPWPDGRGVVHFLGWKIGPWFDETFNHKNFPNTSPAQLQVRHDITVKFIDALNSMLMGLASEPAYAGKVFHTDLRGTLLSENEWANELHPKNPGFRACAAKIDATLQAHL